MSKFRIEIQITLLTIIIGIVVVTIGYFSYRSLSQIVYSIQQGAHPDHKLFVIKDIASDLTALENTVRLHTLTNNNDDLEAFYSLEEYIIKSVEELNNLKGENEFDIALIDSFSKLSQEKLDLWDEILTVHLKSKSMFPAFSKLYSNLDEIEIDTIITETENNEISQNNADSVMPPQIDTIFTEKSPEREEIKKDIQKLEWELYRNRKQTNVIESGLIEENVILDERINRLINEAETMVTSEFLEKTMEADRLAEVTYRRLTIYTISAVLLLLIALFVLFNYLKKTRSTQRALANARKKAEVLAHAKEQFAANVSHELRTPVNAIYGLTEQVLQKKLDKNTSEMVSVIFKSAIHLRNIVNDTLDFSKIQSKTIIIESVHFSPAGIFEEVHSLVKNEAAVKGIDLNINWEGEKPEILIGDPFRLKQIIINLVGNAIKFTEKGEVAVQVNGVKHSDEDFELDIQVEDTGIGIEENNLNIIFDEYVQIENLAGKKYSGTGLGLAIVKKLVELQGGKIKLESSPGKGTKVTVNIKYRKGDPNKIEQAKNEVLKIPELFTQLSVLIVDDEEFNRFLIKSILQKWGIQFKEVQNGKEAINAACNVHFDIIVMDINMPVMNGIEAAKAIKKCDPEVKIVAVTAITDQLDQQACFKAGMKGFLFKPFSEKELFDTIDLLINNNFNNNNKSNLKDPLDFNELRHLAGDDDKFLVEMIQLFVKSMETGISGIEYALKKKKWNDVFENAHKMAAPVKHIGASYLYEKIKHLETISKHSATLATVSPVFSEIKNEVEELNKMLKKYLNKIKA